MTNTNRTETHTEILNLLEAYAVHGGDAAGSVSLARQLRGADAGLAVVALSIDFVRRPSAVYRVVVLEDGSRWLASRARRAGAPFVPCYSCARLDRAIAAGWTVSA